MAKKVQVDIEVNSQSVVDATNNVNGLNNAIQKTETTTQDFGKSVKVEYDKAGNATDVFVDKQLSLTKQIRAVRAQMEILTATGKANSQEFTILQRKFNDLNDNLARNKARSQELFGTLSLLPGPVGTFAASLQGGIDLLKTFSGYKLSDIKNQFKALGDDLKEIFKGFSEFNSKEVKVTGQTPGAAPTTGGTNAPTTAVSTSTRDLTRDLEKRAEVLKKNTDASKMYDASTQSMVSAEENAAQASNVASQAMAGQTAATNTLTFAEKTATIATNVLKAALYGLGIGLVIALIVSLVSKLGDLWDKMTGVRKETEKNIAATDAWVAALKREKEALDLDLEAIDYATKARQTRAKIAGASEKEITQIAIQAGKEKLEALRELDKTLYKEQDELMKRKDLTAEQSQKLNEDINARLLQNNKDIIKQIMENEQAGLDARLAAQEDYYTKKLAEIEAAIQLEIDKDVTSGEKLAALQKQRQDLVIQHEKLGINQRKLLRETDRKNKENALREDEQRVEAFMAKEEDIRIAAIQDNQKREEDARTHKLNQDILNLSYDKEYLKKSQEEKNQILENLETQYQMDLVKIREAYFLRQFQKMDDLNTKEIKQKSEHVLALLEKDQEYLIKGQLKFFGQALVHTNEYLKNRFIDMRRANQNEHDATELELNSELATLKTAYDNKKITQEEYEKNVTAINDRIYENNKNLVDKNIQLDKIELEARKETAQATMDIAQRMVDLLTALGSFSEDFQIAATIADAVLGIAKIITATQVAIAEFSAAVAPLGPVGAAMATAYAIKQKIQAGIGIAAITVGAIGRVQQIKGAKSGGGGEGGDTLNRGKNYGDGGMIEGPRHAGGGVMINAEGGEAVMTRNAVTMFKPLLSMMNQAGGGTSFSNGAIGQANFDNPKSLSNPMEQQVFKTYVVEGELSSVQHKNARLKSLSTL